MRKIIILLVLWINIPLVTANADSVGNGGDDTPNCWPGAIVGASIGNYVFHNCCPNIGAFIGMIIGCGLQVDPIAPIEIAYMSTDLVTCMPSTLRDNNEKLLCESVRDLDVQKLFNLIQKQSFQSIKIDPSGNSLIHLAAHKGANNIIKLLLDFGDDINHLNLHRESPLHQAVKSGWSETVDFLINNEATIDKRGHLNRTPLHYAALYNQYKIYRQLLINGADPTLIDSNGDLPRDLSKNREIIEIINEAYTRTLSKRY